MSDEEVEGVASLDEDDVVEPRAVGVEGVVAEAGQGLELKGKFDEVVSVCKVAGLTLKSAVDPEVEVQEP